MNSAVLDIVWGWKKGEVLYTCIKLGIFESIASGGEGGKTAAELAAAMKYHEDNLKRVMRLAAVLKILDYEVNTAKFTLNEVSKAVTGENSIKPLVIMHLSGPSKLAWGNLVPAVTQGVCPFEFAHGVTVYDYLESHTEEQDNFNKAMSAQAMSKLYFGEYLEKYYPFAEFKHVVDVGGGEGALLAQIVQRNTHTIGTVVDLPQVVAGGKLKLDGEYKEIKDRLHYFGANFFTTPVPAGGDAYVIKLVIHNWNDDKAVAILKNVYNAMADNSKLIVIEKVIDEQKLDLFSLLQDIHMLATCGGKERTVAEFSELYEKAGFKLTKVVPIVNSPVSVIEGVKKHALE
jgi:SAM-dependent methyltransferase